MRRIQDYTVAGSVVQRRASPKVAVSGFFCAQANSALDYVVTHELGHFLHRSLTPQQNDALLRAINQLTEQLVEAVGNEAYAQAIAQGKTEA